jgi:tRNA1Val (adenine37-N6)-methyltransferase
VVFKQFEVHDEDCAMKVGTDALLLGSWCEVANARRIIDAGTGSGIVALMAAQRAPHAEVTGVELEPHAVAEANANATRCPWPNRIRVVEDSIQAFAAKAEHQGRFDAFLINPPFFHGKPKSPDEARNLARHDDALPYAAFLDAAWKLLSPVGSLQVVWPWERWAELKEGAEVSGFHMRRQAEVCGREGHEPRRVLTHWVKYTPEEPPQREVISIELGKRVEGQPQLSSRYKELLSPYVVTWPER